MYRTQYETLMTNPSPAKKTSAARVSCWRVELTDIEVMEGWNLRKDYGDLEELASQILEAGEIREPIRIAKVDGKDVLTNGHRRVKAVALLHSRGQGLDITSAPAMKEPKGSTPLDILGTQALSNSGKPFDVWEEADLAGRMKNLGASPTEISKRTGWASNKVADRLRMSEMTAEGVAFARANGVSATAVAQAVRETDTLEAAEGLLRSAHEVVAAQGRKVSRGDVKALAVGGSTPVERANAAPVAVPVVSATTAAPGADAAHQATPKVNRGDVLPVVEGFDRWADLSTDQLAAIADMISSVDGAEWGVASA